MMLTGKTKVYGIIGHPVTHSLSPVFQGYFAEQCMVDVMYAPFPVCPENFSSALLGLRYASVQGLNITVPFKETVLPYVCMDDDVRCIGAANTLKLIDGQWYAYNTDWQGVREVMLGTGLALQGGQLLMFGAGGTARAVLHAAAALGFASVLICNRSNNRCDSLCQHAMQQYPQMICEPVAWEQSAVDQASVGSSLMMNTTSIGLSPDQTFPFQLSGEGWAMDAVYRPDGETAFVLAARGAGRLVVDGLPMLLAQGMKAFEIWHPEQKLDTLDVLHWMVKKLNRAPLSLPTWENTDET